MTLRHIQNLVYLIYVSYLFRVWLLPVYHVFHWTSSITAQRVVLLGAPVISLSIIQGHYLFPSRTEESREASGGKTSLYIWPHKWL